MDKKTTGYQPHGDNISDGFAVSYCSSFVTAVAYQCDTEQKIKRDAQPKLNAPPIQTESDIPCCIRLDVGPNVNSKQTGANADTMLLVALYLFALAIALIITTVAGALQ